jgi:hypothetical protein
MRRGAIVGLMLAALAAPPAHAQAPAPGAEPPAPTSMAEADFRELLEAARATAKATRESVEHSRIVPDILTQILAKLDKIEDKLDKVENAVKSAGEGRRPAARR